MLRGAATVLTVPLIPSPATPLVCTTVSSLYLFIVVKVTDQSSPIKDSWVVDQVKPVQDPKLLQALGLRPQEGGTQP
jgi:hypothetical protein